VDSRNQARGFRIIARKDGERVTLYSRPGNDFTGAFHRLLGR
jgi:ATP-dependent DNA ligase